MNLDAFTTPRLSAEKLREDHLADLVDLHLDPVVSRYLGGVRSPEATDQYLRRNLAHWDQHGFGLYVLRTLDGQFVGRAGCRYLHVEGIDEVELFYTLRQEFWGMGLAVEISSEVLSMTFQHDPIRSIVAAVETDNLASQRVLQKLSFLRERPISYLGRPCFLFRLARA